ncbi:MAG: hypothetical protein MR707_08490 [Galactobacillus timonensis]|uniref:phage minor capsid protein n=1 Tax=Galactobacillus timonensis TaxID=2041840 RepID=UPI0023F27BDC|nr:phage minor capsid protein [Galactobacillus timonensis]MCI6068244.1 hypothetical protein [Galactobacillus timonensis]
MFTNDQMDRVPDEIAKLFREMENDITFDIVNRLGELNKITRTIDYQLYVATQMRTYDHDLRQVIQQYTNKSQKQMEDMFNEVLSEGYAQDADLYKAQGIPFVPFEENDSMQQMVRALVTQADDDLSNITRTLGIAFRDGTKENLTQYFRDTLNRATVEMMAGAFSYDSTMKRVITELSNSGIRTISYESGHVDRVDVAASRAVRTGFNQAVSKISDANAEALDTEYFEVSAHLTARPSHALWQGKVYSRKQLVEICGLGTGPGLLGWNCRHSYYPFIPGVSKRTYTDEQLADIYKKSVETKEWRGQKYTGYEATQYQRMLERRMRVQDEKIRLMKQAGVDNNEIADLKTKHEATYQEYKQFSEKMGLPEQMNRVFNSEVKSSKKTGEISTGGSSESSPVSSSPSVMHYITPGSIKKSLVATPKSEIPGTVDITDEWKRDANTTAAENTEVGSDFVYEGVLYHVDGKHVRYLHDPEEENIANVISVHYGRRVWRLPKIENVQSPDFFIGSYGVKYDLKTLHGSGKNTIRNAIKDKEAQSHKFILDLTDCPLSDSQVNDQLSEVFRSNQTRFVNEIIIVKNDIVAKALKRA